MSGPGQEGKQGYLFYIFIGFFLLVCLRIYFRQNRELKCVLSSVDKQVYCVRDRVHTKEAADLLATVTVRLKKLVAYMGETHSKDERVKRLVANFNPKSISETLPTSELTAYSENKGEKMALCLSKYNQGEMLIDVNTLTFVGVHELSHIMTKSVGHKQEFWLNFKFLLENAVEIGIYKPEDYKKDNKGYCGMLITDNPYYDL
jgi:hypothetical protein